MIEMLEILFIIGLIILFNIPKWRFNNYMPPEGYEIDCNARSLDIIQNNLTNDQIMRNTVNGKYNKKKN